MLGHRGSMSFVFEIGGWVEGWCWDAEGGQEGGVLMRMAM